MAKFNKFPFTLILVMFLTQQWAAAQTSVGSLLPHKKIITEKKFDGIYSIDFSKDNISVINYPSPETGIADVHLFNTEGEEIWSKKVLRVHRISIAENSGTSIIISNPNFSHQKLNTYYDSSGNKLWEAWIAHPGLTLSNDGKFAITTHVNYEEGSGRFRIFDGITGKELSSSIPRGYVHFFAKFIDIRKIVILLQHFNSVRNKQRKDISLFDLEKYTPEERSKMLFDSTPGFITTAEPMQFIIYDIPDQKILIQKELFSINGNPIWSTADDINLIKISQDQKSVFLTVYSQKMDNTPEFRTHSLIQVSMEGKINWEISSLGRIKDVGTIDENKLIVLGLPKNIFLIDALKGEQVWRYKHNKRGTDIIKFLSVSNNKLLLQTTHSSGLKLPNIFLIDIESGKSALNSDYNENQLILGVTPYNAIIFDNANSKLKFLKSEK